MIGRPQKGMLLHDRRSPKQMLSRFELIIERLLLVFFVLLVVVLVALGLDSPEGLPKLSFLLQMAVIASFGWATFGVFRIHPILLVLPITYLFVDANAVLGLGPLQLLIYPDALPPEFGYRELLAVQGQSITGLFFVVLGVIVASRFLRADITRMLSAVSGLRADSGSRSVKVALNANPGLAHELTLAYRILAATAVFLHGVRWGFGIDIGALLPGFLGVVNSAGSVAIVVGAILASHKGSLKRWSFLIFLVLVESAAGALDLMRGAALMPWLFLMMGLVIHTGRYMFAVAGILFVVVVYPIVTPYFKAGRGDVWFSQSMNSEQYWSEALFGGLGSGVGTGPPDRSIEPEDDWNPLHRFDYSPVQHGLMTLYDRGEPGSTYEKIHWLFLPRFLFPGKPPINFATEVTEVLFGHVTSSTGSTIFGEAYWNGGWAFVILSASLFGGCIYLVSVVVLKLLMERSAFGWLVAMVGWSLGASIGNLFTAGFLGPLVVFMSLAVLHRAVRRVV